MLYGINQFITAVMPYWTPSMSTSTLRGSPRVKLVSAWAAAQGKARRFEAKITAYRVTPRATSTKIQISFEYPAKAGILCSTIAASILRGLRPSRKANSITKEDYALLDCLLSFPAHRANIHTHNRQSSWRKKTSRSQEEENNRLG